MESYPVKKQKIILEDYDYQQDLDNRLLMSQFSSTDLSVLEEILYSSIKIPLQKMGKNLELTQEELLPILVKLSRTGLFVFEEDSIVVDKEIRKYFEGQITKFDPDFKPGMEFLQSLLRKVPIHALPLWYSLPRLSDRIFESIIEKYLFTPQIFHRYLADLSFTDPILLGIVQEIYSSPSLKVYGRDLIKKYNLSKEEFEKALLQLEFHLVGYLCYEKEGDRFEEIITPFYEWSEYTEFLKATETPSITENTTIHRLRQNDFAYVEDLAEILKSAKKEPLSLRKEKIDETRNLLLFKGKKPSTEQEESLSRYFDQLIYKLCQLKLASISDQRLLALESATDFLEMSSEEKALFLYRHPFNRSSFKAIPLDLLTDRTLRESEKSILRVLNAGWVYFDEFIKGVIVPLTETSTICLKKQGKAWRYSLPCYSEEELALIQAVVLEWLFEVGITAVGSVNGRTCFTVTAFGRSLFGQ